ncbi:truncated deoxyribonuclease [Candidatus Jettenia caeni]|uniref:Truncated deoxyribonuclease n=1 Tax=Candidatus Jettenia caeni TaxID=247490 RepID=I3IHK4_9BACT|nr:truncated deoxyribonuclease [Candidatus Jettenia caeni]
MWLTGFDAPCLHTLYIDKPMNGHNLMQAIARVNRVFGDKEGGLVVDYIGIAQDLKKALAVYTESKGRGNLTFDQEEAIARMLELYEIVNDKQSNFSLIMQKITDFFTIENLFRLTKTKALQWVILLIQYSTLIFIQVLLNHLTD